MANEKRVMELRARARSLKRKVLKQADSRQAPRPGRHPWPPRRPYASANYGRGNAATVG